jgi:hypothetical protein
LATFGVPGVLANPVVTLFSGATAIPRNDDWQVPDPLCASTGHICGAPSNIAATGLAPGNPLEAAILTTLAPGPHTAIVSGVGGTTGVGLVEVYDEGGPECAAPANMEAVASVAKYSDSQLRLNTP